MPAGETAPLASVLAELALFTGPAIVLFFSLAVCLLIERMWK